MFEVKTRFRFSSEGGVGEKTRLGGGRFVIGTPSLPSHKHFFIYFPSHKPFLSLSHHTNIFHFLIITPASPRNTKKIELIETNPI